MGELELARPGGLAEAFAALDEDQRTALARQVAGELLAAGKTSQTIVHASSAARAYVYGGEWVADCPTGCNNTELITGKSPQHRGKAGSRGVPYAHFTCSYCGHQSQIDWPQDAEEITQVLDRRPIPHTRNWYPIGHNVAVRAGIPDGQSVDELLVENAIHGVR